MRTARVTGRAADAKYFAVRDECAARGGTGLQRNRAHVPVIGAVSIGVMQTDINAEVDFVVLRVPPARIDDLVCIGRSVDRAVRDTVVHAIVTIIIDPIAEAVGPVSARAGITYASLRWRCAWRRRRWTILARLIAGVRKNNIVIGIVRC